MSLVEKVSATQKTVGLLASPTTIATNQYPGVITLPKSGQKSTENIIRSVIGGASSQARALQGQINELRNLGADKVILGCTELSLIAADNHLQHVIDPVGLYVDSIFSPDEKGGL